MYLKDITKNNFKKALNEVGKLERKQMHLHTHTHYSPAKSLERTLGASIGSSAVR